MSRASRGLLALCTGLGGALLLLTGPVACSRKSPAQEDTASSSWDAAAAKRISITFGQGACAEMTECERNCEAGQADQCRRLADTLAWAPDGGQDEPRAAAYYVRACGMGSAPACLSAGRMHEYHHGVAEDDGKAADFYKRGCDLGHVPSCTNYAIMLENGRGIAKDPAGATKLYREGCKAGVGLACDRLRALSLDAGP